MIRNLTKTLINKLTHSLCTETQSQIIDVDNYLWDNAFNVTWDDNSKILI